MIERIIDELRDAADELTSIRVPWQDIAIDVAIRARLPIHVVADVLSAFAQTCDDVATNGGRTKIFITGKIRSDSND